MRSTYRPILKESLRIAWRNPWLWLLGLFAAAVGSGGEFNILFNNVSAAQEQGGYLTDIGSVFAQGSIGAWTATIVEVFRNLNLASFLVLVLVLIVVLFLLWLAMVCQGGLVSGIFRRYRGEVANFSQSWRRGITKFWPVLGLNVTGRVVTYLLLVIVGLPFFFLYVATQSLVWQWILLVVSFLIFVPVAIIVAFLVKYAIINAVVKNTGFTMAIKEAWHLFIKNWIVSIELAIIMFLINIVVAIGIVVALSILAVPFLIVGFVFYSLNIAPILWLVAIVGFLVLVFGLFALGAFYSTFQTSAWVILFTQLTEGVVMPKILRLAASLMRSRKSDRAS